MSDYPLTDWDGLPIRIGTLVRYYDPTVTPEVGKVIDLGEFDVDDRYDDEGVSPRLVNPSVTVLYADGTKERYVTGEWEFSGYPDNDPVKGTVEELNVLTDEELKALPRTTFGRFEQFCKDNPKLMESIQQVANG